MNFNNRHLPLMAALIFAELLQDELIKLRQAKDPDPPDDDTLSHLQQDAATYAFELYRICGLRFGG